MKILIQCAFEAELKSFIASIPAFDEITHAKRKCLHTKIKGNDIYLAYTGIGTVNAGTTTTALCEALLPDCIIMCGSAGGLLPGQSPGDIIISDKVIDVDLYSLHEALVGTPYEPCLTDPHTGIPIEIEFSPSPSLLGILDNIILEKVNKGVIATSNTFPAPKEAFARIKELGCAGIEMESTGVFNAARHYNIPVVTVRVISNSLDDSGNDLGTLADSLILCSDRLAQFLHKALEQLYHNELLVTEK